MNRHYDRYLTLKYAPLYKDRYANMTQTAMCWGFAVGDGWFNLINTLSRELCYDWLNADHKYRMLKGNEGLLYYKAVYGEDSKEDRNNYRITSAHIDKAQEDAEAKALLVPVAVQVKEKFGGLRFYVNGATDEQYAKIHFAESMSTRICERCGAPGKQRSGGWVTTLCNTHYKERRALMGD